MLLQSPLQELKSPYLLLRTLQLRIRVGKIKNVEEEDDGDIRKKMCWKSPTKSPKPKLRKAPNMRPKNPKARIITPKTGAKTPTAKASRQRAKASESGDIAGKDAGAGAGAKADVGAGAGAGADQSLTLCIRKEKIVEEMPTPLPASYQPSVRKVEVIESPNWLPHGWITEMKTRGTGSSAGTKDKVKFLCCMLSQLSLK